jgi:hypothetical protein
LTGRLWLVLVTLFSVGALDIDPAAARPSQAAAQCIATGARTTQPGHPTNKYVVSVRQVTCAFAKSWVARLSYKPTVLKAGGGLRPLTGGPAGFKCIAIGVVAPHTAVGQCFKSAGKIQFGWYPK